MSILTIEGCEITATSPEGQCAAMPLPTFVETLSGRNGMGRRGILPDGIKAVETRGKTEIWIQQLCPRVYNFKWIEKDSKVKYGKETTYRKVRISLPYLITFAVFCPGSDGKLTLSGRNECFFSNQPIDWDTELCFPALLNCSKYPDPEGNPLAWICTQYLDRSFDRELDPSKRMRLGFTALLRCLLNAGFNYSSEHNEGSSWFSESISIDSKISTVENWEQATTEDPLFVLDIPWLRTGLTTSQVTDRIFDLHQANQQKFENAGDLSRVVFNHGAVQSNDDIAF